MIVTQCSGAPQSHQNSVGYQLISAKSDEEQQLSATDENSTEQEDISYGKSSAWKAVINILSDIEGPSILALHYVISQSGLVAIATLIIFSFITYYTGAILIRPVYTGDFCRSNSVQFLSRRSCNFKIARVNHCDFGAMLAIYRRGMRYNSRKTVTLSNSFTF